MKIDILSENHSLANRWFLDQIDFRLSHSVEIMVSRKSEEGLRHAAYVLFDASMDHCNFSCSPFFKEIIDIKINKCSESQKKKFVLSMEDSQKLEFTFEEGVVLCKD